MYIIVDERSAVTRSYASGLERKDWLASASW
jgi:hypothetical protein